MSPALTQRLGDSDADLARAAELLVAGELVGLPTETVYGLAVRADDPVAIERLYAAKGRPADNPLIVHVATVAALASITRHVTPLAELLLERFAPGPLTIVLDAHPDLPRALTAGLDTVAVRIPDHPIALDILRRCAVPLAAPSANRSGRPSPTTAAHVHADLDGHIAAVVDGGPTRLGLESTVVDARGSQPIVLREGAVTREELVLACASLSGDDADAGDGPRSDATPPARAPGTLHRHYSPELPVHLAAPRTGRMVAAALLDGLRRGVGESPEVGLVLIQSTSAPLADEMADEMAEGIVVLGTPVDAAALAVGLYAFLRHAEDLELAGLVIEQVSEVGIGRAVMDRLRRAAEASGGTTASTTSRAPTIA